ncbi:uncharacterized protein LOC106419958 [Brassica napus]|uniref:uncharacterized protein LOC106419958 n=1 Tax=Brassica napus TaxID=3708 RepID=UPI0020789C2D|nr:uncharacterized protein LOC106419958 [Brassica napus]
MNILGICNLDMLFTYAYVGVPGSAHDAKVLALAMEDPIFPHPPLGKYFLLIQGMLYVVDIWHHIDNLGKWRIMQDRARYDIQTTRKLVAATMTLHNFVRKSSIPDPDFEANWQQGGSHQIDEEIEDHEDAQMVDSRQYMEGFRDEIAMNLWNSRR